MIDCPKICSSGRRSAPTDQLSTCQTNEMWSARVPPNAFLLLCAFASLRENSEPSVTDNVTGCNRCVTRNVTGFSTSYINSYHLPRRSTQRRRVDDPQTRTSQIQPIQATPPRGGEAAVVSHLPRRSFSEGRLPTFASQCQLPPPPCLCVSVAKNKT
jgi:hypothetical protein